MKKIFLTTLTIGTFLSLASFAYSENNKQPYQQCLQSNFDQDSSTATTKKYCYKVFENMIITKTSVNKDEMNRYILKVISSFLNERKDMSDTSFPLFCDKYREYIFNDKFNRLYCVIAMQGLGWSYYDKNQYNLAFNWLIKSEPETDTNGISQFDLGYMYQSGSGTAVNLDKALYWYTQALKAKNFTSIAGAFSNIGMIYNAKQNYQLAFQAYYEAAKLGNAGAQMALAEMYKNGTGTIQNYVQAYAWVSVAVANGFKQEDYPNYQQLQNTAVQLRENTTILLSSNDKTGDQLSEAKKLATKYYQLYVLHDKSSSDNDSSISTKIRNAWDALTE